MDVLAGVAAALILAVLGASFLIWDSWKPEMFTRGIPVLRFTRPFAPKVAYAVVGKLIEVPPVIFLFVEQDRCIFRVCSARRYRFRFPLKGEIQVAAGLAKGVARIPASLILAFVCGALALLLLLLVPAIAAEDAAACLGMVVILEFLGLLLTPVTLPMELEEFPELVDKIAQELVRRGGHLVPAA